MNRLSRAVGCVVLLTLATPAIARGSVILRTPSKLYRIAEGGQR